MNDNTKIFGIIWALVALVFISAFIIVYLLWSDEAARRRTLSGELVNPDGTPFVVTPLSLTGAGAPHVFTPEALRQKFEQVSFTTGTYFTGDERHRFSGPRLSDVVTAYLARQPGGVQTSGDPRWWELSVTASAGDNYGIIVPTYDVLLRFDPIIAVEMDGAPLPEEYGPLWLVFNRDARPDLTDRETAYWVWNLERIDIEVTKR